MCTRRCCMTFVSKFYTSTETIRCHYMHFLKKNTHFPKKKNVNKSAYLHLKLPQDSTGWLHKQPLEKRSCSSEFPYSVSRGQSSFRTTKTNKLKREKKNHFPSPYILETRPRTIKKLKLPLLPISPYTCP